LIHRPAGPAGNDTTPATSPRTAETAQPRQGGQLFLLVGNFDGAIVLAAAQVGRNSLPSGPRPCAGTAIPAPHLHAPDSHFPHGESPADALRRHANALRRLLARTETVTLVVIHEFALRHIAMAAAGGGSRLPAWPWPTQFRISSTNVPPSALPPAWTRWPGQGSLGNSRGGTDRPVASHFTVRRGGPAYAGVRLLALHHARRRGAGRLVRGSAVSAAGEGGETRSGGPAAAGLPRRLLAVLSGRSGC
jgi:Histidine phosphatase superfamily (branch 1)